LIYLAKRKGGNMLARILVILLALLPALPFPSSYPPDVYSIWGSFKKKDCLKVLERRGGHSRSLSCDHRKDYKGIVRIVPVFPRGWLLRQFLYTEEQGRWIKEQIEWHRWNVR
jgi:hypothetical protein